MKNIALCFDHVRSGSATAPPDATNAAVLIDLLVADATQLVWSYSEAAAARRRFASHNAQRDSARTCVAAAYTVLVEQWFPGDRLFLFGTGRGAACARALARLLGTVGVLREPEMPGWTSAEFRQYVLATYAMPRTRRDPADWQRVHELATQLSGRDDVAVDVAFLGLWDTAAIPGVPRVRSTEPLPNVRAARHALAIDAGGTLRARPPGPTTGPGVEEVWFRGAHCDVAGGPHSCRPLADLALDWVLDGAVAAGAVINPTASHAAPAPGLADAAPAHLHPRPVGRAPVGAAVHASVQPYLRARPSYWRRLPARVVWADPEWAARAERLWQPAAAPGPQLAGAR